MEYDVLIRIALRDLLIPVGFLNWMSEGEILTLGERLYHGWHYLRDMTYPDTVSAIHETLTGTSVTHITTNVR